MRIVDLSVALKAGIVSDPPSMLPKIEYQDHKDGAREFAAMFPGLQPEQLNLERLPPFGFKVCCFPVKIEAASAGWTHCVALLDD